MSFFFAKNINSSSIAHPSSIALAPLATNESEAAVIKKEGSFGKGLGAFSEVPIQRVSTDATAKGILKTQSAYALYKTSHLSHTRSVRFASDVKGAPRRFHNFVNFNRNPAVEKAIVSAGSFIWEGLKKTASAMIDAPKLAQETLASPGKENINNLSPTADQKS